MVKKDVPRWENDRWISAPNNPKDCEGCIHIIDKPLRGDCKMYPVVKPSNVYHDGAPCPKKQVKS
jgi:hypothetical protein